MLDNFRETAITWDKANRKVYEPLRVSAGDNKGRKLSIQVVNGGVVENLSGASLSLFWETKDKMHKGLDVFTAVDATKGEFEIYYTTGMLSNEGTLNANLVLVDTGGRVVSEPFTITVFKGIDDDAIQSSDSFTALAEALITVNQYDSRITNVENSKVDKSTFEQSTNDLTAQLQQTEQELNAQLVDNVKQTKTQSFLFETKTGVIAHRGAHRTAPENTVKSIYEAGRLGYEMVELDVQRTSDGVYMLMHDSTVDRTTNGTGPLSALTFDEAKGLVVDESYLGKSDDEIVRIPTFEEACRECQKWGLGINVDGSKIAWIPSDFHEISRLLKKYGLWERSFFVLSNYNQRLMLNDLYPDANLTWLTSDTDPTLNIAECKNYLNAFVTYSNSVITDVLITEYRANDIPIFVHSCNTTTDLYKYFTKGVRFVETDFVLPKGEV